ncbi:TlpA disulfide reductase family protein [Sphingobacterium sp. UBA6645]|uniref:TlpA disulfide reductase family protein n=1 Tax=Sphingobacterium sp. UBA6645 TaxID=1947511 RepID=UPI0025F4D7C7|nr:TlpA disulfide reductase family protein [Sphingobacterium sp. UBA6645]
MKKITLGLSALLSFVSVSFAQTTTEDFSGLFNALKSAVRATDKAHYATRMVESPSGSLSANQFLLDASLQMVATTFAEEKKYDKAAEWTSKIKDEQMRQGTNCFIAGVLISDQKFKEAHQLLDVDVKSLAKDDLGNARPSQEQLQLSLLYGELLFTEKKYEQAASYLHAALEIPKYVDKYKELYVRALINGNSDKVNEDLIENVFLAEGHRSSAFKNDVQAWYNKKDGNDKRYLALEGKAQKEEFIRLEAKVSKMAVNKPAPDFEVKDIHGNSVSLANLKGKTVILDFWATWCQPCVASFPGMQKAVDYYKNDPSVVFMFIHTSEKKGANVKEQSLDLMNEKGYKFDVYLDLRDPNTGKCPAATAFEVRGIPAKFVINKEGIIKFANEGYIGEDEAVEEIKFMVERSNQN